MTDMPEASTDHEAVEAALAGFYAQIPDAIRDLIKLYVISTSALDRRRLRGRINALLGYVEADQSAGLPPPPPPWLDGLVNVGKTLIPMLLMGAVQAGPALEGGPPPLPPDVLRALLAMTRKDPEGGTGGKDGSNA